MLIVLDQFEQWFAPHPQKDEPDTEWCGRCGNCDGARVQCVVMVRDDFWLAAVSRFLGDHEVQIVGGIKTTRIVDLFDPDHARRVLESFGRGLGGFRNARKRRGAERIRRQRSLHKPSGGGSRA